MQNAEDSEREKRQAMMKDSVFSLGVGSYFKCCGSRKKSTGRVSSVSICRQFCMNMKLLVAYNRINCKYCRHSLCEYVCVCVWQRVYEYFSNSWLKSERKPLWRTTVKTWSSHYELSGTIQKNRLLKPPTTTLFISVSDQRYPEEWNAENPHSLFSSVINPQFQHNN